MDSNGATTNQAPVVHLATRGNYQSLREFFFKFRDLTHQRLINVGNLSRNEAQFIKDKIVGREHWSLIDAHQLYTLLARWEKDLRTWGHDYSRLVPPSQVNSLSQRERPAAAAVVRQQSVTLGDGCLLLYLAYQNPLHDEVKRLFAGRSWDGHLVSWRLPYEASATLLKFARQHQLQIGESALRMMDSFANNLETSYSHERVELNLPLKKELFDYQTVGTDFAIRMRRTLIADQMGLGKTPTAIAAATGWNRWPILVVCPKSLRGNWKREIHDWTHYKAQIGTPKVMRHLPQLMERGQCDFLILNYEGLKTYFVQAILPATSGAIPRPETVVLNGRERMFKGIIVDEAHECKNQKTERFKVLKALAYPMEYRCLLTGSPFVNHVNDLCALVELLGHLPAFRGRKGFMEDYGRVKAEDFAAGKGGVELRLLNNKMRQICMIRREKHQVLAQLPDKFRHMVPIEIDNRREYDLAYNDLQAWLRQNNQSPSALAAEMLVRMGVLKRLSCQGKIAQGVDYVNNILAQGQKVVVFVWHRETIEALRKHWPTLLEISGGTNDDVVDANKALFQESRDPRHNVIVITYKRGGVGHTLTAASNVVFFEFGWNPKDQDQAEDRCHRIGQKDNVTAHYLTGKNTIDEWIYELIQTKRHIGKESVGSTEEIVTSVQSAVQRRIQSTPTLAAA